METEQHKCMIATFKSAANFPGWWQHVVESKFQIERSEIIPLILRNNSSTAELIQCFNTTDTEQTINFFGKIYIFSSTLIRVFIDRFIFNSVKQNENEMKKNRLVLGVPLIIIASNERQESTFKAYSILFCLL